MAVDLLLHLRLLGEERVEVGVGLGEGGRDRVEAIEQVAQLAHAVLDVAAHVLRVIELRLLLEEPDGGPRVQLGDAGRRFLEPGHDPHQRRLAGAVRSEHADLGPGQEGEGDVREHLAVGAVELVDPVHRVDVVAAHGDAGYRLGVLGPPGATSEGIGEARLIAAPQRSRHRTRRCFHRVLADHYDCDRVLTLDERHFRALRSTAGSAFTVLPAEA